MLEKQKQQRNPCSCRGVSEGERAENESREGVGGIVPGLVGCGEDFAFSLRDLGAPGGL